MDKAMEERLDAFLKERKISYDQKQRADIISFVDVYFKQIEKALKEAPTA